jgi:4-hydroxybenzoate polyprenyltransferase
METRNPLRDWISLARPKHWSKNVFVLMPVPFALAAGAALPIGRFAAGLIAFSLASSAVYAFNDAQDAPRDRQHKRKRFRSVAADRISVTAARIFTAIVAALATAISALLCGFAATRLVALYLVLNVAYSLGAKHIALLDVFILASGFVLRVLFGCALLDVTPSAWLLLCSSSLALFLGLAKRRADLAAEAASQYRPVLAHYNLSFLDQAMTAAATTTILAYALYGISAKVLIPGRELAALPFVVFGVLDYLRIAMVRGEGGEPVETILASPTLICCGAGWAVATLWSIRFP